jgi:hypothetical protein
MGEGRARNVAGAARARHDGPQRAGFSLTPRRDYRREEACVLGAWHASLGDVPAQTEDEIRNRAGCSPAAALRVYVLRRAGSMTLVSLWLDGCLTLRQVERIALSCPFDEERQADEARAASPIARARLSRP